MESTAGNVDTHKGSLRNKHMPASFFIGSKSAHTDRVSCLHMVAFGDILVNR